MTTRAIATKAMTQPMIRLARLTMNCGCERPTEAWRYVPDRASSAQDVDHGRERGLHDFELSHDGAFDHVRRDQVHTVRHEVAARLVAAQTLHARQHLLAETVEIDFGGVGRAEQHDGAPPEREREVH